MKKGIICALALPLAAGALAAIGASSKNVSETKAEVGDMPAYTEKVVSISAARTRMPAGNTPTRVGIEFQALGTDWAGNYLAVVDKGYPMLANTFKMKDFIQIDGAAYTFWNSQDFRAIVQEGWMEPAFKIADMASKSSMVVTLKKGLKLPSRQYIANLNAGLAAEPDKSSWETPADVYTLDATYTITFKAVANYETELKKAGGSPMSVEKIEVDRTEIAKQGDRYWLQSVNCVTAASNRFSFNLCVDSNTTNDFPSDVVQNGNYYTNGDGKKITELAQAPAGLTTAFMLDRAKSLNLLQGNMVLDGEPITYVYNTDGERNSSGYNKVSFFDTTKGRIVMNKNSDGRVKITADVIIPNFATGKHRFMIKRGTEFPSWSYIMGTPLGATPSNGVYKLQKDLVWDLSFTSAGACTVTPVAASDNLPTPEKVDSFGLADRLKFDVNGGDAFRIWMNPISEYTRCGDGDDPHGYYTNRGKDQNIHYGEATEYATNGNANQLHVWDHVLINGQPAPNFYRDSRLHINGVSSSNVGFQDGKVYGSFWFEILAAKAISGTADDTLSIKFLKGMELPTQETANGTTKATYLELDQDTEFILKHVKDAAKTEWTVVDVIRSNGNFNTVTTAVKSMHLIAGDEGDARAMFDLSDYDYTGGFAQFNCGSLILGGEYNIIDNLLINNGDDSEPTIPASTLGYAHNRYFRVPVSNGAVGYNMGTSPTAPSFNQITVKAGTRFPAFSYLNNGAEKVTDVNVTPKKANEKFFVTEEDVTLFHVGNGVFKTIEDVRADALKDLEAAYPRADYREAEQVLYDVEVANINAAETKVTVDVALDAAKVAIADLHTDGEYKLAEAFEAAVDAIVAQEYGQELVNQYSAAVTAYKALNARAMELVDTTKVDKLMDIDEALYYITDSNYGIYATANMMAGFVGSQERYNQIVAIANNGADALIVEAHNPESESALFNLYSGIMDDLYAVPVYLEDYISLIKDVISVNDTFVVTTQSGPQTLSIDQFFSVLASMIQSEDEAFIATFVDNLKHFTDAYVALPVAKLINAIGTVTLESGEKITAAREAYNALTDDQKARLDVTALTEAEAELARLQAELQAAKENAVLELQSYKNFELYREAQKVELNNAILSGTAAINEAQSLEGVDEALTNAKAVMDAVKTDAELTAEELAAAKTAAKAELESYKDPDLYRDAEKAQLALLIAGGKEDIDSAETIENVAKALKDAKDAIDMLKTDAEYTAEELAAAKVEAKLELESYKDPALYRDAEKAQLAVAVSDGKEAIDLAETVEGVELALGLAKAVIDEIKTDAELTAEELAAAKVAAKLELESYKDPALYRDAEKVQLATAITNGKNAIDAAETIEDVAEALADAKVAIDAIKTDAEYTAEELAAAKTAAKAELDSVKAGLDMSKYTAENKAAIDKAVSDGKAAIDAATTKEAVASAKAAAVAAINAVPQITPEPKPEPKGCGGSVIAASGAVALVSLLGVGLVCLKRKEN